MTNKSKIRHGLRRSYRFNINPTTRAIRNAFALGLALASVGPALAGTCTNTAPSTIECDGDFSNSIIQVVDDLTLIVGGNLPTTIAPPAGSFGIVAIAPSGSVEVINYADITTVDGGGIFALASGYGGASVVNGGDVLAYSYSIANDLSAVVYGVTVVSESFTDLVNTDTGSISAVSKFYDSGSDGFGDAIATGAYVTSFFGTGSLVNHGDISASATTGAGQALSYGAIAVGGDDATTTNDGSITATATADGGSAYAYGSITGAAFYASLYNDGTIAAAANAADGHASSRGAEVVTDYGDASTNNTGSISANATGYYASAVGSVTSATWAAASLYNSGSISATAVGDQHRYVYGAVIGGYAYGAIVGGYFGVSIDNEGSISATSTGLDGRAVGVLAIANSGGDVYVYTGADSSITATGHGVDAIALEMESEGTNTLVNYGSIVAAGDGARVAISSSAHAVAQLYNYGTITGSIQTSDYGQPSDFDDYLLNDGTWNAVQTSSFGDGDDTIIKTGLINMGGATIDLGGFDTGNVFDNAGTIHALGGNLIDMGQFSLGGPATLPLGLGPVAFVNNGVISFLDGHADDSLTIAGNFTGIGSLSIDVDATTHTADHLIIEGDINEPSRTVVNGVIVTPVTAAFTDIPFAFVNHTSQASDFTLGGFSRPSDLFFTLDTSIVAHINSANTAPDVFSLGLTVSGLSPRGVLASSIVPGVQNLWHASVGTVFQREGTVRDQDEAGLVPWLRVFKSSGDVSPDGVRDFGGGGAQGFKQDNWGAELGLAYNFNQEFSAGILLGKSEADIDPDTGGNGKIKADSYGVYATWTPGYFYLDGSWRTLNYDTDSSVAGGAFAADGSADGFSIEMGYAFTTDSGLKIEPQLQYSTMNVDSLTVASSTWGDFVVADSDSKRLRVGVALRKTFTNDEDHSWTPYLSINQVRESAADNDFTIGNAFSGQSSLDGKSTLVEGGATAQFGAWTVFGGLNWQDGGAFDSVIGGQLGVRYSFGGHRAMAEPAPVAMAQKSCADSDDDGDGVNNCNDKCLGSLAGQAIGPDGCPVPLTIDLKGVNFDFNMSTLRPDAVAILDEAIAILGKYPELKVEVAGHTDSIGSEEYNQGLSERRARTVYDYLDSHGIDAGRLVGPTGYGESRPSAPNTNEDGSDNPEGRAKNRRTELDVEN